MQSVTTGTGALDPGRPPEQPSTTNGLFGFSSSLLFALFSLAAAVWVTLGNRRAVRLLNASAARAARAKANEHDCFVAARAEQLEVCVCAEEGKLVSLGTSVETPASISGSPLLTAAPVAVRDASGGIYQLQGGALLRIFTFPGAQRNLVQSLTTETGVEQRHSFEVTPEQRFWLVGVPLGGGQDSPFRDGAAPLLPFQDRYLAALERLDLDPPKGGPPHETTSLAAPFVVMELVMGTSFIPWIGTVLWSVGLALSLLVFWTLRPDPLPLPPRLLPEPRPPSGSPE